MPHLAPTASSAASDTAALRSLCAHACHEFLAAGDQSPEVLVRVLAQHKALLVHGCRRFVGSPRKDDGRPSGGGAAAVAAPDALFSLSLCFKRVEKTVQRHLCGLWNEVSRVPCPGCPWLPIWGAHTFSHLRC
jgi:hypothetical protein